ncbi:MAG: hypothetical protein WC480_00260 [Patescibacteria group bacterium]
MREYRRDYRLADLEELARVAKAHGRRILAFLADQEGLPSVKSVGYKYGSLTFREVENFCRLLDDAGIEAKLGDGFVFWAVLRGDLIATITEEFEADSPIERESTDWQDIPLEAVLTFAAVLDVDAGTLVANHDLAFIRCVGRDTGQFEAVLNKVTKTIPRRHRLTAIKGCKRITLSKKAE